MDALTIPIMGTPTDAFGAAVSTGTPLGAEEGKSSSHWQAWRTVVVKDLSQKRSGMSP